MVREKVLIAEHLFKRYCFSFWINKNLVMNIISFYLVTQVLTKTRDIVLNLRPQSGIKEHRG